MVFATIFCALSKDSSVWTISFRPSAIISSLDMSAHGQSLILSIMPSSLPCKTKE